MGANPQASGKGRREAELVVRVLHLPSMTWSALTPTGQAPPARGSHSVSAPSLPFDSAFSSKKQPGTLSSRGSALWTSVAENADNPSPHL